MNNTQKYERWIEIVKNKCNDGVDLINVIGKKENVEKYIPKKLTDDYNVFCVR